MKSLNILVMISRVFLGENYYNMYIYISAMALKHIKTTKKKNI